MRPRNCNWFFYALFFTLFLVPEFAAAQEYKLRQVNSVMGMKSESTIYVKGMRKRTEGGSMMGMPNNLVTIEQCDLKRTVTINDKKKMYCIEPFVDEKEEPEEKPAVKKTTVPKGKDSTGGTIHMYYNIRDTGERKKMYGFTARHIWTTQKMKPSPDACTMKDSMIIKTDGWYIDLPQFNCPVRFTANTSKYYASSQQTCTDKFVSHRSGNGKLGFPLIEKRTMIMGGKTTENQFEMDLETLELTTGKLDSMLFEIPPGYTETKNCADLQDKFDPSAYIKQYQNADETKTDKNDNDMGAVTKEKKAGVLRIGVMEPKSEEPLQLAALQQHIVNDLDQGKVEAVAVLSEEDAKGKHCDYLLNTDYTRFKPASKIGGLLKAVKNADPNAASSYNIDAAFLLTNLSDGSTKWQQKISGKYDGKPEEAAKKPLDEGCSQLLQALK